MLFYGVNRRFHGILTHMADVKYMIVDILKSQVQVGLPISRSLVAGKFGPSH